MLSGVKHLSVEISGGATAHEDGLLGGAMGAQGLL